MTINTYSHEMPALTREAVDRLDSLLTGRCQVTLPSPEPKDAYEGGEAVIFNAECLLESSQSGRRCERYWPPSALSAAHEPLAVLTSFSERRRYCQRVPPTFSSALT